MKGGDYHSINAKSFFDTLGIDYTRATISYNVSEIDVEGNKVLKFTPLGKDGIPIITGMVVT